MNKQSGEDEELLASWIEDIKISPPLKAYSIFPIQLKTILNAQARVTEARVRTEAAMICAKMKIEYAGKHSVHAGMLLKEVEQAILNPKIND